MSAPVNIEVARGLTRCASDCLDALNCLLREQLSSLSIGILAGHCAEAALKAHLACAGWNEAQLKALGHDLQKSWSAARSIGLNLDDPPPRWVIGINVSHLGLRYRYPSSWEQPWLPHPDTYVDALAELTEPLVEKFLRGGGKYVGEVF